MTTFVDVLRDKPKHTQGVLTNGRIALYQEANDLFKDKGSANHAAIALIGFPHNVISFIGDSVHVRSSF